MDNTQAITELESLIYTDTVRIDILKAVLVVLKNGYSTDQSRIDSAIQIHTDNVAQQIANKDSLIADMSEQIINLKEKIEELEKFPQHEAEIIKTQ